MRVVEKRKQKRHCDRLEFGLPDGRDDAINLAFVERRDDRALRIDALGDLEAPAARHQNGRRVLKQVVEVGPRRAAQLEQIAKAPRRDESRLRALLFEQRVGDDRCRMRQQRHLGGTDGMTLQPLAQASDDAFGEITRSGRDLDDADAAGLFLDQCNIGERPADIDPDPPRHPRTPDHRRPNMLPSRIEIDQQRPSRWI
jgi:hypothetical protein